MKTIMIDMDDVITGGNFEKIVSDYLGREIDYKEIEGYYIQDVLGNKKDDFFKMFKEKNLYENAVLKDDCYDVLKELSKKYKIYICTDYIWREMVQFAGNTLKDKYEFLYNKLDFINPRNLVFVSDKSIINCDIKIDDRICNIEGAKIKILFTAYHNKNITDEELKRNNTIRANNWKEVKNIIFGNNKRLL